MNLLDTVWGSPLVHRFGCGLLHFLWQGFLIAVLLAGAMRLFRGRSAGARYLAAWTALLAMAVSVPITAWLICPPPMAQPVAAAVGPPDVESPIDSVGADAGAIEPYRNDVAKGPLVVHTPPVPAPVASPAAASTELADEAPAASGDPLALRASQWIRPALPWVVCCWIAGALVLSLWRLSGWMYLQRLRELGTGPAPDAAGRMLEHLLERLKIDRAVQLLESALIEVPTVIGWLRPVILLPASILAELPAEQLESILAHELAHVRRHDFLLNLVQTAIETLLFYHPAVWWVSRRIRTEREACCDEVAVARCGDRMLYARALTKLEELRHGPAGGLPAKVGVAADGAPLLSRVRRVLGLPGDDQQGRRTWLGGSVAVLLLIGALVAYVATAGDAQSGLAEKAAAGEPQPKPAERASAEPEQAASPKRAQTVHGRVLDAAGKPVAGAKVFLSGPQTLLLIDGKDEFRSRTPVETDAQGRFLVARDGGEKANRVIVTAPSLHVWIEPVPRLDEELTIKLPEPATLVLRYDIEGDLPEVRFRLQLDHTKKPGWTGVVDSIQYPAAENGGQVTVKLTPGSYGLARLKPLSWRSGDMDAFRKNAFCDQQMLELKAGERKVVDFVRPAGQRVLGEVVGLPEDLRKDAFVYVSQTAERREIPVGKGRLSVVYPVGVLDAVTSDETGKFTTARIPPGPHTVTAHVYKPGPQHRQSGSLLPDLVGMARVTVPEVGDPPKVRIEMKPCSAGRKAAPSRQAEDRATQLKSKKEAFELRLAYHGPKDNAGQSGVENPYRSLIIHTTLVDIRPRWGWSATSISEEQAARIIDHLKEEGFLANAQPLTGDSPPQVEGPAYSLTVKGPDELGLHEVLGWDLKMLRRLDALRKVLDGKVPKYDELLARLEPQRKLWEAAAAGGSSTSSSSGLEWGQAVEGVQVRLRAEKSTWKVGEPVALKADVRNRGNRNLIVYRTADGPELQIDFDVEVGGKIFRPERESFGHLPFGPGKEFTQIPISVDPSWRLVGYSKAFPLRFGPGKHTIQAVFHGHPANSAQAPVRAVSKPVEIEVVATEARDESPAATEPKRAERETAAAESVAEPAEKETTAERSAKHGEIRLQGRWPEGKTVDGGGKRFGIGGSVYVFDPADPKLSKFVRTPASCPGLEVLGLEFISRKGYPRVDVAFRFQDGKMVGPALFELTLLDKDDKALDRQRALELRNRELPVELLGPVGELGGTDPPNRSGKAELRFPKVALTDVSSYRLKVVEAEIPLLVELLEDPDVYVRECAARALGQSGVAAEGSLPKLQELSQEGQDRVRSAAKEAVQRIQKAAKENHTAWGKAVDGVQVQVRAGKSRWNEGRTVRLWAHVRNQGTRNLLVRAWGYSCEVEVDGRWYRQSPRNQGTIPAPKPFPPGRQYDDIAIDLSNSWELKTSEDARRLRGTQPEKLKLTGGKHTIRVAFTATAAKNAPGNPVRAVSNPIVIEVISAEEIAARPTRLKSQKNAFELRLAYHGPRENPGQSGVQNPIRSLILHTTLVDYDLMHGWSAVQISEEQAARIIDHLQVDGSLVDALPFTEDHPPPDLDGPAYSLTIRGPDKLFLYRPLGWGLGVLDFLERLRAVLDGEAARAVDQVMAVLGPQRKQWEAVAKWGRAVEGVQVRLRAEKPQWKPGTTPQFYADVRNLGTRNLLVYRAGNFWTSSELEIDGRWYRRALPQHDYRPPLSDLVPGRQFDRILVDLRRGWSAVASPSRDAGETGVTLSDGRMKLAPGKHIIRVAPTMPLKGNRPGDHVRAVSKPVEIEIVPGGRETEGSKEAQDSPATALPEEPQAVLDAYCRYVAEGGPAKLKETLCFVDRRDEQLFLAFSPDDWRSWPQSAVRQVFASGKPVAQRKATDDCWIVALDTGSLLELWNVDGQWRVLCPTPGRLRMAEAKLTKAEAPRSLHSAEMKRVQEDNQAQLERRRARYLAALELSGRHRLKDLDRYFAGIPTTDAATLVGMSLDEFRKAVVLKLDAPFGLRYRVVPEAESFGEGEPVWVTFLIENVTDKPIKLKYRPSVEIVDCSNMVTARGALVYPKNYDVAHSGKTVYPFEEREVSISPGQSYTTKIDLLKHHYLLPPARYTITAQFHVAEKDAGGFWHGSALADTVSFEIQPASNAGSTAAWSDPVDGLRIRLRPTQRQWKSGTTPTLALDLRNDSHQDKTSLYFGAQALECDIEADGQWYRWAVPVKSVSLSAKSVRAGQVKDEAIKISLTRSWARTDEATPERPVDDALRLNLRPGTHRLRVAFTPTGPPPREKGPPVVSMPVEIEIVPRPN